MDIRPLDQVHYFFVVLFFSVAESQHFCASQRENWVLGLLGAAFPDCMHILGNCVVLFWRLWLGSILFHPYRYARGLSVPCILGSILGSRILDIA